MEKKPQYRGIVSDGLAVLAKAHNIPFYVAVPLSSFDLKTPTGREIPIEERPAEEVTEDFGKRHHGHHYGKGHTLSRSKRLLRKCNERDYGDIICDCYKITKRSLSYARFHPQVHTCFRLSDPAPHHG